jgi:hypothetical protein
LNDDWGVQELSSAGEQLTTTDVGLQAEVADPDETTRQYVE